jgi:ribose transport system permease protein
MAKPIIRNAFKPVMTGRAVGLLIATILLSLLTASVSHTFLSSYTVFVLSRQMAFSILVALAQAVCLVVGGMNMSVGAIGSMATVIMGICFQDFGLNPWLTVPLVLLFGLAAGLLNGLIITKLRINSFIVTLSTMFVFMGLRSGISGGSPYTIPDDFGFIGQESIFNVSWVFVLVILILAGAAYVFFLNGIWTPIVSYGRQRKRGAAVWDCYRSNDPVGSRHIRNTGGVSCSIMGLNDRISCSRNW